MPVKVLNGTLDGGITLLVAAKIILASHSDRPLMELSA